MRGRLTFACAGILGAACLLGSARPADTDPDLAKLALQSAKASLAKKDWATARSQFQRALDEDPTLVEARLGLGEACVGGGDRARGAQAMRGALSALEEMPTLSAEQVALYTRARKRVGEVNRDDGVLDLMVRKHADVLVGLAAKWSAKDLAAAAEAAQAALRLAPDHPKAADLKQRLSAGPARKTIALFNGRDGTGWTKMSREWTVENGTLVGNVPSQALLLPSQKTWSGDFDVLVEACLLEEFPKSGPPHFAVMGAWVDPDHNTALGYLRGDVMWRDQSGPADADEKDLFEGSYKSIDAGLDPKSWITYEIRFRGNQLTALVGGKEIARAPRPKERMEGHVVLKVQCCKAAFRRIEITPR